MKPEYPEHKWTGDGDIFIGRVGDHDVYWLPRSGYWIPTGPNSHEAEWVAHYDDYNGNGFLYVTPQSSNYPGVSDFVQAYENMRS